MEGVSSLAEQPPVVSRFSVYLSLAQNKSNLEEEIGQLTSRPASPGAPFGPGEPTGPEGPRAPGGPETPRGPGSP